MTCSYAVRRGLHAEFTTDRSTLRITGPDVEVVIALRPDGLVKAVTSSMAPQAFQER